MTPSMTIDGVLYAIGAVKLHFQYFLDDGPPHAWLDILSDSKDDRLAGLAINCLNVGDIPSLEGVYERTFSFDQTDEIAGAELSESVFWKPNQQTLAISSLQLQIGKLQGGVLPIEIVANCFDLEGRQDIAVAIIGEATVVAS